MTTGDERYSTVDLVDQVPETISTNVLGILREVWKHETYFLPDGTKVRLSALSGHGITNRVLWVLLANTVYNPKRTIATEGVDSGTYTIGELKSAVLEWVDQDDDILTQFLEPQDIKVLLSHVHEFDDLIFAIRAINGEFEIDESMRQHLFELGIPGFMKHHGGQ